MTVDPATAAVYRARAREWAAARRDSTSAVGTRLRARCQPTDRLLDLGCGAGVFFEQLGPSAIGLDPIAEMLAEARADSPGVPLVQGEAGALPFLDGAFGGVLASKVYVHVDRRALPMALADLRRVVRVGGHVEMAMFGGDQDLDPTDDTEFPGRNYALWDADALVRVCEGAGFSIARRHEEADGVNWHRIELTLEREVTLPDTVGPGMRVLVCGLNPSIHAAEMGVGFGRSGNRFWPAALAAGLATVDRDPVHALERHGMGMTDLVKRATRRADELEPAEYATGLDRLEWVCGWLQPRAVCMVGLAGWRVAVDRKACAGWQGLKLGGCPVYVMPSTSGLNAHSQLADLTEHLQTVADQTIPSDPTSV